MGDTFRIGRITVHGLIAKGGMGSVHVGQLQAAAGITRLCAVKRMHQHLLDEPHFVSMFLDEARVAARIQHPNVVALLDVVQHDDELLLVMELVRGVPLSRLLERNAPAPLPLVAAVIANALEGLHAAHEARDEQGAPLGLVHRDVSPQNVMVGADGIARMMDFGVAKASVNLQKTREGQLKGKLRYMAPEQMEGDCTRRTDIFSMGVVLWEALAGRALFTGDNEAQLILNVLNGPIPSLRLLRPDLPEGLEDLVERALSRDAERRPESARAFARELRAATAPATPDAVAEWVASEAGAVIEEMDALIRAVESAEPPPPTPHIADSATAEPRTMAGLGRSVVPPAPPASPWLKVGLAAGAVAIGGVAAYLLQTSPVAPAAQAQPPLPAVTAPLAAPPSPVATAGATPSATAPPRPEPPKPRPAERPPVAKPASPPPPTSAPVARPPAPPPPQETPDFL